MNQFSEYILPLKDLHCEGPEEVHAKLLRLHFPDPANERRNSLRCIKMNLNRRMNLSGLNQRFTLNKLAIFID